MCSYKVLDDKIFNSSKKLLGLLKELNNTDNVLLFVINKKDDELLDLVSFSYKEADYTLEPIELSDISLVGMWDEEDVARGLEICSPYFINELNIDNLVKSKYGILALKYLLRGVHINEDSKDFSCPIIDEYTGKLVIPYFNIYSLTYHTTGHYCFVAKVSNNNLRVYKMFIEIED